MDLAFLGLFLSLHQLVEPLHDLVLLVLSAPLNGLNPLLDLDHILIDWLASTTLCLAHCCCSVLRARDESLLERICS